MSPTTSSANTLDHEDSVYSGSSSSTDTDTDTETTIESGRGFPGSESTTTNRARGVSVDASSVRTTIEAQRDTSTNDECGCSDCACACSGPGDAVDGIKKKRNESSVLDGADGKKQGQQVNSMNSFISPGQAGRNGEIWIGDKRAEAIADADDGPSSLVRRSRRSKGLSHGSRCAPYEKHRRGVSSDRSSRSSSSSAPSSRSSSVSYNFTNLPNFQPPFT